MLLNTTGAGASTYTSDADGNTLTGGGRTNTWDSQNRLASCAVGNTLTTYTYGADGLRRRMEADTQFGGGPIHPIHRSQSSFAAVDEGTSYAYDGTMLVREGHSQTTDGVSSLQPETVTATYFIGARGPEYRRDDTQTETDSQGRAVTKARWYVYDGLGSVVGEVDPAGNLTSSPKYDVYGAVRANGGSATSRQGFVGSLGHVSDDTGLIYMRARYYDPNTGRFESEDPSFHGHNWFAYCENNPVSAADRSGKSLITINHVFADDEMGQGAFDAFNENGLQGLSEFLEENYSLTMNFSAGEAPGIFGRFQMLLTVQEDELEYMSESVGEFDMDTGYAVDAERIGTLVEGAETGDVLDSAIF